MHCVFVVEDSEPIRELIEYLLRNKGFDVRAFETAGDFAKSLEGAQQPDLIILDVMLPDGNGIDICRELKSSRQTSHIPVLLMSANATAEAASGARAEAFIAKPFDIDHFMRTVRRQIA